MCSTTPSTPAESAVPHAGGVSEDEFRAALSRFTAGVVLVTAHDPEEGPRGEDVGMTATAFMSVSLDPPLVMVSVRNGSRMDELLERQPHWAVSVLSDAQRHIAGRFAMKGRISDRLLFQDMTVARGAHTDAPLAVGALATLECRTEQRVTAGDHTLVVGRVLEASAPAGEGGPLTYYRGRYRTLG
ncbi:flavin reductase family protein [Streptomyces sp. NPDC044780]|uniref:Flavin reductase family protein n=1 Tax=Streptomyces luomodiensis TaxID=3026192 RepID=A0ABY9UXJ5_9ACTN|nr:MULTISPECIES: flavin reductase family protein [unclassified Streptomyces]WAP56713.1 flavin reductase family protein [Streptomyces sp. S465]WNE97277.1 flavin reductase family protein [Streptomyces sp. SCA4-21]